MKISKKDLSLLLVLVAVVLLIGAIFYGNTLASKTETLNAENETLKQEVEYLQDLSDHKQEYLDEAARMNEEMEDIKEQFPAEIRPETQIMYANGLEAKLDVILSTISMPGSELVTVTGDFGVAAPEVATEETDEAGEMGETGVVADAGASISTAATTISLMKSPTSFTYESSYRGLKDLIRAINEDTDKKSIESITVALSEATGNLSGSLDISMYSLTGTGKEYQPPVVTGVTDGVQQIITGGTTLNRTGAKQTGDAATADGKAGNTAEVEENE